MENFAMSNKSFFFAKNERKTEVDSLKKLKWINFKRIKNWNEFKTSEFCSNTFLVNFSPEMNAKNGKILTRWHFEKQI